VDTRTGTGGQKGKTDTRVRFERVAPTGVAPTSGRAPAQSTLATFIVAGPMGRVCMSTVHGLNNLAPDMRARSWTEYLTEEAVSSSRTATYTSACS
jgi:hypothetical protein